jgi:hypothetical protein
MIVTDKFVFVHLPRSGGTFVTSVIKKFFPLAHEIGHHAPRELLPREYSHLPVLCTVRNPWEFYVSFYHYLLRTDAATLFVSWMTQNGRLGFEGSIRNLLNLGVSDGRLDLLLEMLPERIDFTQRHIPSVTKDIMCKIRDTGIGYYTFRFYQMFGNVEDVFFCRLETLSKDLVAFFAQIEAGTTELQDYVLCSNKVNASEHRHYSTYYTPELAEFVLVRDRQLIERFGYVFEETLPIAANRSFAPDHVI